MHRPTPTNTDQHRPTPTNTDQHRPIYFFSFLKFFLLSTTFLYYTTTLSQDLEQKPEEINFCGSIADTLNETFDPFFGNNQALVDILLDHKIAIPQNYLENLESGNVMSIMSEELFSVNSPPYYIPIKAWVYRNNNGIGNIDSHTVYDIVEQMNNLFSPLTNIHFYLLCDISFVNNSNFANFGDLYFDTYTSNNTTAGAIDVHFVLLSKNFSGVEEWGGKAVFPFSVLSPFGVDANIFSNAVKTLNERNQTFISNSSLANVLAHEIGHNLGLRHTHRSRSGSHNLNEDAGNCYQESVSRTKTQGAACVSTVGMKKCEVNGDELCDTQADPGLRSNSRNPIYYYNLVNCEYNTLIGGTDNWGESWTPIVGNIMGYANVAFNLNNSCYNYFSPMQTAKMYFFANYINTSYPAFTIIGPGNLCNGQTASYTVNTLPGVTSYNWAVPSNLTILSGQGTTSINVLASTGNGGAITVMPSCGNKPASRTISSINFVPINGLDAACPGQTYTYSTPALSGASYTWTAIENATIVSGQGTNSVQVTLNNGFTNQSYISVAVSNYCSTTIYGNKIIAHADPVFPEPPCFVINPIVPIEDLESKNLQSKTRDLILYPNPAREIVNIIAPDEAVYDLVLFNMAGQALYRKNKLANKEQVLNLYNYEDGVYFVYLINENKTYSKRLILKK